jgi:hypothetical protein
LLQAFQKCGRRIPAFAFSAALCDVPFLAEDIITIRERVRRTAVPAAAGILFAGFKFKTNETGNVRTADFPALPLR